MLVDSSAGGGTTLHRDSIRDGPYGWVNRRATTSIVASVRTCHDLRRLRIAKRVFATMVLDASLSPQSPAKPRDLSRVALATCRMLDLRSSSKLGGGIVVDTSMRGHRITPPLLGRCPK